MSGVWLSLRGVARSIWSHTVSTSRQQIGRLSECPIQLLHESVSRRHAEIWSAGDKFWVRDLGSSNGTFVNGNKVSEATFQISDTLQLGKVMLDVVEDTSVEVSTDVLIDRPTTPNGETNGTTDGTPTEDPIGIDTIDMSLESLTEAQLRVLRVLLTGKSEKEVAETLFLSPHTVHSHVRAIYQYYDVNSRGALMAHFIQLALSDDHTDGQSL